MTLKREGTEINLRVTLATFSGFDEKGLPGRGARRLLLKTRSPAVLLLKFWGVPSSPFPVSTYAHSSSLTFQIAQLFVVFPPFPPLPRACGREQ